MPTLTTIEQTIAEDEEQAPHVVGSVTTAPIVAVSKPSPPPSQPPAVTSSKPTPKVPRGKRTAAAITPSSSSASKRKKQQGVASNQLSIASFFQQKQPPPASPLAHPPPATSVTSSSSSTNPSTANKAPQTNLTLAQRRAMGQNKDSSAKHMDSLASFCVSSTKDARSNQQQNTGGGVRSNRKSTTPKTIKSNRPVTTKESLREIVLGCCVSPSTIATTSNSPPLVDNRPRSVHDNHLLPRILAPSLLRKKKNPSQPEATSTSVTASGTKSPTENQNMASTLDRTLIQVDQHVESVAKPPTDKLSDDETPQELMAASQSSVERPNEALAESTEVPTTEQESEQESKDIETEQDGTEKSDVLESKAEAVDTDGMEFDVFVEESDPVLTNNENTTSVGSLEQGIDPNKTPNVNENKSNSTIAEDTNVADNEQTTMAESITETNDEETAGTRMIGEMPAAESPPITAERQARLGQVKHMKTQYCNKVTELVTRGRDGLEEESMTLSLPSESPSLVATDTPDFPESAAPCLAVLLEGSRLSLSALASMVVSKLNEAFHTQLFTIDMVTAKVKVMAKRESFLDNPNIVKGLTPTAETKATIAKTNVFEDENPDRMWRWEVISLDLFSDQSAVADIKKARAARRKLRSYFKALSKLLLALNDTEKLLFDVATSPQKLEAAEAKVSQDENQVLKFEREQEKNRIATENRKKKQEEQAKKLEAQKVKASGMREEQKKQKATEREEMKRKKAEEKERQKAEREALKRKAEEQKEQEKQEREAQQKRQQSKLLSFLGPKRSNATAAAAPVATPAAPKKATGLVATENASPSVNFRSQIGTSGVVDAKLLFQPLSESAVKSRKRRTKMVSVPVYVTTIPDESFDAQPYLEQKVLRFPNKYKFLSFHEDCRPPYHGTWSKRSKVITGRNPFGKDNAILDYDNDSEAEWEEGDDEMGEDIESNCLNDENEDAMEDEEGDPTAYNYEDGWMQRDDDFGTDLDEETKLLLQKKLQGSENQSNPQNNAVVVVPACAIGPMPGGTPLTKEANMSIDNLVEGFEQSEAMRILAFHESECLVSNEFCLYAFPPAVDELPEDQVTDEAANVPQTRKKGLSDLSSEDLRAFARFVHRNTLPSKDKVLDELRTLHKTIVASRAQGARTLDSIAIKKRHSDGCIRWEVKREILEELGLQDLIAEEPETQPKIGEQSLVQGTANGPSKPLSQSSAEVPNKESLSQTNAKTPSKDLTLQSTAKTPIVDAKSEAKHVGSANLLKTFLKRKIDDQASSL